MRPPRATISAGRLLVRVAQVNPTFISELRVRIAISQRLCGPKSETPPRNVCCRALCGARPPCRPPWAAHGRILVSHEAKKVRVFYLSRERDAFSPEPRTTIFGCRVNQVLKMSLAIEPPGPIRGRRDWSLSHPGTIPAIEITTRIFKEKGGKEQPLTVPNEGRGLCDRGFRLRWCLSRRPPPSRAHCLGNALAAANSQRLRPRRWSWVCNYGAVRAGPMVPDSEFASGRRAQSEPHTQRSGQPCGSSLPAAP